MFFDRSEIHIQAFVDFINGKLIKFQTSSPQNYFRNMYSYFHKIKQTQENTWYPGHTCFENCRFA